MRIDKAMLACHKPDSLKDLVIPSELKFSHEENLKSSVYVAKRKGAHKR